MPDAAPEAAVPANAVKSKRGKKARDRFKKAALKLADGNRKVSHLSDDEHTELMGKRPFSPLPRARSPGRSSAAASARPAARRSPSPWQSPARSDGGERSKRVRFASPMRDPTPPALRADELAASLLREADDEVRASRGPVEDDLVGNAKSYPRLDGAADDKDANGKALRQYSETGSKGNSKGNSKGKKKKKKGDKGKSKGKSKSKKKGDKKVRPPPGDW